MAEHGRQGEGRKVLDSLLEVLERPDEAWIERVRKLRAESSMDVLSELIRLLTHVRLTEKDAEEAWRAILAHRTEMQARLGRDVGLRLAVFDWFVNIDPRLKEPTVMELAQFERTERSAMTDWLTGLYNRGAFRSAALRELRRAQRYRQTLSVIFFDLDDFKVVNDRFGHELGDQVLREVSRLLRRSVRDVDVAARFGGEEFAVLLPETGRSGAVAVADRVRNSIIKQTNVRDPHEEPLKLTVSGGIAVYPDDGGELGDLLRQADAALYRAKAAGKNCIVAQWVERRVARRFTVGGWKTIVTVRREGANRTLTGSARDISRTGLSLMLPELLEVGQKVKLSLANIEQDTNLALTGRVVRHASVEGSPETPQYEVGVGLEEASLGKIAPLIEGLAMAKTGPEPSARAGASDGP